MNQDHVFEFSEHFDGPYLCSVLGNNLAHILDFFATAEDNLTQYLAKIRYSLESGNREATYYYLHNLLGSLLCFGQKELAANTEKFYKKCRDGDMDPADEMASYHSINLSIVALFPFIRQEINRMKLYLDTHYPPTIWSF